MEAWFSTLNKCSTFIKCFYLDRPTMGLFYTGKGKIISFFFKTIKPTSEKLKNIPLLHICFSGYPEYSGKVACLYDFQHSFVCWDNGLYLATEEVFLVGTTRYVRHQSQGDVLLKKIRKTTGKERLSFFLNKVAGWKLWTCALWILRILLEQLFYRAPFNRCFCMF